MENCLFGSHAQSSKFAACGKHDPDDVGPDQFSPTDAMPGSQEKLRVLVQRSESGLPLWHPADRIVTRPAPVVDEAAQRDNSSESLPPRTICAPTADADAPRQSVDRDQLDRDQLDRDQLDRDQLDRGESGQEIKPLFDFERLFGVRR